MNAIATKRGWGKPELLAVVGLLGGPTTSLLRMELRAADGSDVPPGEIARKLASWWKDKTMTEAEWKAWASQIDVFWTMASRQGIQK